LSRLRFLLLAGALAVALVWAAPAITSSGVRFGLQDDAWLKDGPGTVEERATRLELLGVRLVRFTLNWNSIAARRPENARSPDDAAYDWRGPDLVLEALRARGIAPMLTLVGTPAWANGGKPSNVVPVTGRDFADFAFAAGTRYAWVKSWLVWNEPNQRRWLLPSSPGTYVRRLLNPAYESLHLAVRGAKVGGGVTAPRGSRSGVSPVEWIRGMGAAQARLDAYAHNPYPSRPSETPSSGGCDHCQTITMATLERLLGEARRAFGPKRIWLTEYGYQTNPPDQLLGVPPATQARYVGESALRAYLAPRVDMLIHFLYQDEPDPARFQSGLRFLGGRAKPALTAFRLPLAQISRTGQRTVVWGQIRPGSGARPYRLQQFRAGAWSWIGGTQRTGTGGTFRRVLRARPGSLVRVWSVDERSFGRPLRIR
jgi:hypothetical protein